MLTVVRARLATDRGKSHSQRAFLPCLAEDVGHAKVVHRIGAFEGSVSSAALGVDNSFWNSLAVEMGDEIDQVEVLEQEWAIDTDSLGFVWVRVWSTIAGGVNSFVWGRIAVVFVGLVATWAAVTVGLAVASSLSCHDCAVRSILGDGWIVCWVEGWRRRWWRWSAVNSDTSDGLVHFRPPVGHGGEDDVHRTNQTMGRIR